MNDLTRLNDDSPNKIEQLVDLWADEAIQELYPDGVPLETTFASMERQSAAIAAKIASRLNAKSLAAHADGHDGLAECPTCQKNGRPESFGER